MPVCTTTSTQSATSSTVKLTANVARPLWPTGRILRPEGCWIWPPCAKRRPVAIKLTAPGQAFIELGLINGRGVGAHKIEQSGVAGFESRASRALQVLIAEGGEILGIVEDLTDHFAPGLRVAPQLGLDNDNTAIGGEHQIVDLAQGHRQLGTDGNQLHKPGFNVSNGRQP